MIGFKVCMTPSLNVKIVLSHPDRVEEFYAMILKLMLVDGLTDNEREMCGKMVECFYNEVGLRDIR